MDGLGGREINRINQDNVANTSLFNQVATDWETSIQEI